MSDQKDFSNQEYKELFGLADEVDQCVRTLLEMFNQRNLKLFDLPAYQRIFLFIITRSVKTYSSILELCRKGFGQDVSTLLRGLLENLITARYILYNKDTANDKAARFVAYKWVIFKRHLPEQEKILKHGSTQQCKDFLEKKKMIIQKVEEFKDKFKITSDRALVTWSGKTIRDMARQVDEKLLDDYETTFRLCSRFSHPSILGDNEYLIQDDKSLIFSSLPSNIGIVPNLKNAIRYILDFLKIINDQFKFEQHDSLKRLQSSYEQISKMSKYSDHTLNGTKPSPKPSPSIKESRITFKTHF